MKLFIIVIDDVYEFTPFNSAPIVETTIEKARERLAGLYASARETYEDQYDSAEFNKDSFSLYPGHDHGANHYDARIHVVEVPGLAVSGA